MKAMLKLLFELVAIGEMAVGVAVAISPRAAMGLLLAAPVEGIAAALARMLGIAAATIGITWWLAVSDLDEQIGRMAPGFLFYHVGVGTLFLSYASTVAAGAIVPWIVGTVHLLAALALCAVFLLERHTSRIRGGAGL